MAMDDDTLTRSSRMRSPSAIAERNRHVEKVTAFPDAANPPPKPNEGEPDGGPESFDPASSDYKAFGRAGNKTLPTLRVIKGDGTEWPIVYAHLDTNPLNGSQFVPKLPGKEGNIIFLRVAGNDGVFMIAIKGIRLRRIWELIMSHQTPWIHERAEGEIFTGGTDAVIWSITATAIKPERAK